MIWSSDCRGRKVTQSLKVGSAEHLIDNIQRRMLEILLEESKKNPTGYGVHRSDMKRTLNISEKKMDFNMTYLAKRNLVNFVPVPNYHWLWAKITKPGIDIIETILDHEHMSSKEIC